MKPINLTPHKSEIIHRYQSGESLSSISESLGVSHRNIVKRHLLEWGVNVRDKATASQIKNSAIEGRNKRKLEGWSNLNFRVKPELHEGIQQKAQAQGISLSQAALNALCDYLGVMRVEGIAKARNNCKDSGKTQVNVFVPTELHQLLKLRAGRDGASLNDLGNWALREWGRI